MSARSLLFVPADSDRKIAKSAQVPADLLILDLEDSVAPQHKAAARERARAHLVDRTFRPAAQLWVRINPLHTAEARADLAAVMSARPDGIVQPKTRGAQDVLALGVLLDELERQHGLLPGSTRILPIATEVPAAVFTLGTYAQCRERLYGLTWGAEDLSAAVGASTSRLEDGSWTAPYQWVRSLCLFGASAAGVPAIDTVHTQLRDLQGLRAECGCARRDGFAGKLAIHPDQVTIINECFMPTPAEIADAQHVIEEFAQHPGVATVCLNGRMLDRPHLLQAQQVLQRARRAEPR